MTTTILDNLAKGARVTASVLFDGGEAAPNFLTERQSTRGGAIALVGNRSATYEALYRTQPWVRIAVDRIAHGIGRLPLSVYVDADEPGARTKMRTGALAELLAEPWERHTPTHLKQAIMKNLLIHENAILVKDRPGVGRPPAQLLPSSWAYWDVVHGANGQIDWFVFNGEIAGHARRIPFRPDEVIHFHSYGTGRGTTGDSRMESIRRTLMVEDATQRAVIAAFENGIRPIGAYSIDGAFKNRDGMERMRAQLNEVYGSVDNAFKVMLLEGGAKWQDMSHNFVDADLVNLRKLTREEVAAAFNIPPPAIGILDRATFSNITEQHLMEYQDTLQPWTTLIEETLLVQLIMTEPTMDGQYAEFNFKEVMKGDPVKELEILQKVVGGPLLTADEARATINMPPLPDGQGSRLNSAANTAGAPAAAPAGAGA